MILSATWNIVERRGREAGLCEEVVSMHQRREKSSIRTCHGERVTMKFELFEARPED